MRGVSGDWEAAAQRSAATAAAGDGDDNEVFGDFEDVETGAEPVSLLIANDSVPPTLRPGLSYLAERQRLLLRRGNNRKVQIEIVPGIWWVLP